MPVPLLQEIVTAIGTLADHYGVDDVTTLTQDDIRRICPPTPVFSFTATGGGAVVAASSLSQNKKSNKAPPPPPPEGLFASTSSSSSSLFPAAAARSDEVEEAQERLNRDEEDHRPPPQGGPSLFGSYVETMPVSDGSLPPSSACLLSPWRYSQTNAYRSLSMGPEDPPPLLLLAANHHQQQHSTSCCIVAEDDPRHRQEQEDDENASGKFAHPRTSAEARQEEFRTTTLVGPSDGHNNNEEVPNNEFVGSSSASLSLGRRGRSCSSPPLSSSSDDRLCETQVLPESRPSTDLGKNKRHTTRRTCESGDKKVDATTPTAQRTSTSAAALTGDVTPSLPKQQRQTTTSSSNHTHSQSSPTTATTEAEAAGPAISRTIEATLPTDDATARVVWIRAALSIPTTAFPLSQQQQPKRDRSTTSLTFSYTAIAAVVNPGATTTTTAATAVCSPARPYDYISEKIHFQKRWISAASDPQLAQLQQPAAGEVEQVAVPEVSSPVSSTSSCVCCFCGLTISDRQKVKHRLRAIVRFNKAYHQQQQQQQDQHVGDSRRSSTEQQQQQQATAAEAESMAWLASITEDTLEALLGPLVTVAATTSAEQEGGAAVVSELKAHRACLWHSAEVALRYIPHVTSSSSFSSKPLAVGDIAVENVLSALKRGKLLKCAVCGEKGATLGCARSRCRKSFHVGCALWADSCVVEDRAPPAVIQAVVDGCSVSQQLPNNNLSYRGFAPHTATVSSPSSSSNNKPKKRGRSSQTNDEDGESGPLQEGSSGSVTIPKMQVWCVCCFDRTMK